jgi:predicted transposase/invertase (TIGR01784 family)
MSTQKQQVKYLDPKNDLTFRKIFGERPHLIKSFLNSILPLEKGQLIEKVEYLEPELIPELPNLKRSIVDVHCTDNHGRYFIVEMQMYWTSAFKQRMLFNTGKAFVRQLKSGGKYRELKPVYGLSWVDDIFHTSEELKDTYYHHYRMVHAQQTNEKIEGLELIFIELPKFKAKNFTDKKIQTLWLRFLTEIDENTETTPDDLIQNEEIKEALECVVQAAFTKEELLYYDQYWDAIRVEKAAIDDLKKRNKELTQREAEERKQKEEAQQREAEERKQKEEAQKREAEAQQREAEARKNNIESAKEFLKLGLPTDKIAQLTGLSPQEIEKL